MPSVGSKLATTIAALCLFLLPCDWAESREEICGFPIRGNVRFERADSAVCTFEVGLAETPAERQRGLMHCRKLLSGTGVLFVYGDLRERSFWMKNTALPLAIVFIAPDGMIASIAKGEPYSPRNIPSGSPVRYVLEINYAEAACLKVGDLALLTLY